MLKHFSDSIRLRDDLALRRYRPSMQTFKGFLVEQAA
jgi:hypothetical protein